MKKLMIAMIAAVLAGVANAEICIKNGDASLSPIRLNAAKIPGCSKAHVCNDLQYCRSMPGLSPILTAGYSNTTPRRVRGSTETSENT